MKKILGSIAIISILIISSNAAYAVGVKLDISPAAYQRDDYCAEVCIQEALRYMGKSISQKEINKAGGGNGVTGLWSDQIITALRKLDVKFTSWKWKLEASDYDEYIKMIKQKLDAGYPVLVGVKNRPTKHPNWFCDHFILLIGYDDNSFIFNSPSSRGSRTFQQFKESKKGYTLTNKFNVFFGVAFGEQAK